MRTLLVATIVFGVIASGASAARMYMEFADGSDEIGGMMPGETATINIYVDLVAGEAMTGFFYANMPAAGIDQVSCATDLLNFAVGGVNATLGSNQVAIGAATDDDAIKGPVTGLLAATQVILFNGMYGDYDIFFGDGALPTNVFSSTAAGEYTFLPGYESYAQYYSYGKGMPELHNAGQPPFVPGYDTVADGLVVHCPEPTSVALLALGGLSLIRRR